MKWQPVGAKMGMPMFHQGHTEHRVLVEVTDTDGTVRYRWWRGRSVRAIRCAAREYYSQSEIRICCDLPQNYYGAH